MIKVNAYQYYQQYLEDLKYDAKTNQVEFNLVEYVDEFPKDVEGGNVFRQLLNDLGLSDEFGARVEKVRTKIIYANEDIDIDTDESFERMNDAYEYEYVKAFIRDLAQHLGDMTMTYEELARQYDEDDICTFNTNEAFVMWYYDVDGLGYQKGVQDALKFETRQAWINSIKNDNTFDLDDGRIVVVMGI